MLMNKSLSARASARVQPFRSAKAPVLRRPRSAVAEMQATSTSYELDPDNASILVCGGGGVALSVTRKLKDMGSWVWMMQRTDVRKAEIEKMMAFVPRGDALNKDDVQKVMDGIEEVDAVVCTLGGSVADPRVDSEGNINIIEAAIKKGVKKFILVTSVGCGNSKDAPGEKVYNVLKPVLVEKDKAEERLKAAGAAGNFQYVIIRPGGLVSEPATGKAILTEDASASGMIAREDVATLVCKALFSKKADGKVLTAIDLSRTPGAPERAVFQL
ncbi:hypothetical protein HYH02_000013 [Chlamydomonas schloesseri]|uniref:NAD(P)-binding domain-containing protein n=1 Tax=Chlamydomonas schloesseri TaxID=2026947 RepID=A0A835WLN6_9CHLO|nr:hypothetical protein HYH02_000013 [Chlamydomonas schloesseri]|eukprot:KAG2449907.1 hypothetical protein HYH02_000013 [Chlamydomonas schloesseri]